MENMENFSRRESGDDNIKPQYPSAEGIEVEEVDVEDITLEGSALGNDNEPDERSPE